VACGLPALGAVVELRVEGIPVASCKQAGRPARVCGDQALDQCGKHLNDCRLRFPQGNNLPSRAFPGLDKYLT
jgi:phage-related protein